MFTQVPKHRVSIGCLPNALQNTRYSIGNIANAPQNTRVSIGRVRNAPQNTLNSIGRVPLYGIVFANPTVSCSILELRVACQKHQKIYAFL